MTLPTINIPAKVRFVLYLVAAVGLLTISYASDKSWAGDAEVRYVTGLAALLNILAAAKTDLGAQVVTLLRGRGEPTLVGEKGGPELPDLPPGARVVPSEPPE